ncbi:transmembrane protein 255B [Chanos chanos]|uniref:Transmembrane protein 255B n=1 Tax=Chanos chanos TaxID=29144 RepID=A0A6J2ULZ2_CHACN|nr:transmembrane protein 255B-like [Chanos chanos]
MTMRRAQEGKDRDKPVSSLSLADMVRMRKKRALWLVVSMLSVSLVVVALGIYTSTRTESVSITGYTSGVILVAAIVFLSFGIVASFLCLVVDGVFILLNIDIRPLKAGRCQFYTSGNSYIYENYYASVPCQGLVESCSMKVRSGTCYCCDLYNCANGGYLNNYYEFVGVRSCQEVLSLYVFIWLLTSLNLFAFVLAILTTAVLGSIKDLKSCTPDVSSWGGFPPSLVSSEGENISTGRVPSPTAPMLMDHNTHAGPELYPRASLYFTAAAGASASQPCPSQMSNANSNPPAFAPLY